MATSRRPSIITCSITITAARWFSSPPGSVYAIELLKREFEGRPLANQLVSAIVPGFTVEVPQGRVTGGTFRSLPLCTSADQTGCVVSYVSFRQGHEPPADAMFGHASRPDWTVACTNPAALGSNARVPLNSYFYTGSNESMPSRVVWSSTGPPPAQFVHTPGLATAACVSHGRTAYLSLGVNADPRDARTDDIPGEIFFWHWNFDGWGMHPRRHERAPGRPHPHGCPAERRLAAESYAGGAEHRPAGTSARQPDQVAAAERQQAAHQERQHADQEGTFPAAAEAPARRRALEPQLHQPCGQRGSDDHRQGDQRGAGALQRDRQRQHQGEGRDDQQGGGELGALGEMFFNRRDGEEIRAVLGRDREPGEAAGRAARRSSRRREASAGSERRPASRG